MDDFQRQTVDRLARIETKLDQVVGIESRVTSLEKGEGRRNTILGAFVAAPAALGALWALLHGVRPS